MIDAAQLDAMLQSAVEEGALPGVVAVVGASDRVLYRGAAGTADERSGAAMTAEHVFRIASMTKLATTLVALQLVAESKIDLDAEVGRYLPEFDRLQVLDGFGAAGEPRLRPSLGKATVRSLLSHTSGLGYDTWSVDLDRYLTDSGGLRLGSGRLEALTRMPLIADPGTSFHYGVSMDWLGRVLERVTGLGIDELFAERLFAPLGMADTTVWARDDIRLRDRLAAVHVPSPDGWRGTDADYWAPDVSLPEFYPAGHCLYATADDFLRLQQVALGGGQRDGIRIIPAELAEELYADQLGGLDVGLIETAQEPASANVDLRGWKWSLGLLLADEERPGMRSRGSAGWAGGFNTFYWMDRRRGITAALHTATLPFYEPGVVRVYEQFERAVNGMVDAG